MNLRISTNFEFLIPNYFMSSNKKIMNKLKLSCTILFLLLAHVLYCQAENASVSLEELQEIEMNLKQSSKEIKNSTKSLNDIGKKILICLYPLFPSFIDKIFIQLFEDKIEKYNWPEVDKSFIKEKNIDLPIQVNGKFVTTYQTQIDYEIDDIYDNLINISKVSEKIKNKKLVKKINVQNKIINLIFN